ncbi:ammonium transporter [Nocardia cyriacigeorgica]|uniref:Ammonium transporter n=1 Tax=Nocardia cyriacigeorgica TaxID=135487 RepID=A0A6P1D179_9NOCA|nr:ammonium transporter [Nocardia cyriacigeorgica]NEW38914.1 ammonium transporter [Nocardia cyriacigeorgica]NEW43798.1 ammonium transporter [Nocardia cyriacigeorgica]NEW50359.1 ammonium transporter [Nocardia cyriacigeorgica]NEW54901.1 ammonium transporter [Nocardia cyriacigeorgica]
MIFRKIAALVVPVAAAIVVGAGTTHAQPAAAPVPDIGYEAKLVGDRIITTLTGGTFEVAGNTLNIKDSAGNTAISMPLAFRQDGLEFPMPRTVRNEGRELELTVVKDYTQARPVPVTPVASLEENQRAQDAFLAQFGIATAIGGFIGTVIGAIVGLVGIALGPTVIASVLAGAALGGIIGTVVVGGPTLLIAGIDLINTLAAPPGSTKWMDQTGRN